MIPKECKRLAEVDFPIAAVSRHSAREKAAGGAIGHPNMLQLWWARRPLAACRAMLMALLLPDPADPQCPAEFKPKARKLLPNAVVGKPGPSDLDLRQALLKFIGDFANWGNSAQPLFLNAARGLVRAAHGEERPLVADPFAGGGSIPLEALRLGCDAFASDLNPVACFILKTMLEEIPRHGPGFADEMRKAGAEVKAAAKRELAQFYPPDPDGSKPIAYLWARTVVCDHCGCQIPLVRSFWLCKKPARKRALRYTVMRPNSGAPSVEFEVFEPANDSQIPTGTVSRAKATCPACRLTMPPERVRAQLRDQRGGADVVFGESGKRAGGARMLAVVTLQPGQSGRSYRAPTDRDYEPVRKSGDRLKIAESQKLSSGINPIPDEPLPPQGTLGFRVQLYGMTCWGDLFTARQKLTLATLAATARGSSLAAHPLLRCAEQMSTLVRWRSSAEAIAGTFGRQALPMMWDFAEICPIGDLGSNFAAAVDSCSRVIEVTGRAVNSPGTAHIADAGNSPLPAGTATLLVTDPPYYDAIPYADLSDFFLVWLKRILPGNILLQDPFDPSNPLSPKDREVVQDSTKFANGAAKDQHFFEAAMARAFSEGRRILADDGLGCVVFAHKSTEGWEALLSGIIGAGWVLAASWPIATERAGRLRSQASAALATSIHLVCRPRAADAPIGDWSDVARELPIRVGDWIERLQAEGIRGADLVFACIGPAMEIYSRYRRVEDAEGREIPLGGDPEAFEPYKRGFLAYVWETVGRLALEQVLGTAEAKARNGAAGALEEDSRLTALFLWTLQATDADAAPTPSAEAEADDEETEDDEPTSKKKRGFTLVYDVARRFAQPLGIHLDKWEGRIIQKEKGVVRLIPVAERARQLFGESDIAAVSHRIEQDVKANLNYTFAFMQDDAAAPPPKIKPRRGRAHAATPSAAAAAPAPAAQPITTLDRLHAAMLLQRSGQSNGLRALLKDEINRGPDFLRLANSLSALYPKDSDEKRLLDAMLLAVPR